MIVVIHDQTEKERTISFLKGINEVVLTLNKSRSFEAGLDLILQLCKNIFNVDGLAVFFHVEGSESFKYACGIGLNTDAEAFLREESDSLRISRTELGNENGWAIAINEANQSNVPIFPELFLFQSIASAAYASITEHDQIVGLLAIFNNAPRVFNEELLLLSAISNEIGSSRLNSRLQEELLMQAQIDSVTSLMNRRYFLESANQYYIRGKFNNSPLTVFMIDVDHFKQINDRFGHLAGDQALRAIAQMLNKSIRPGDLVGRYGGDEFAIILPSCVHKLAEIIIRRIENKFHSCSFLIGDEHVELSVSIGFAVANFEETETIDLLLNQADSYMYKIKYGKRN